MKIIAIILLGAVAAAANAESGLHDDRYDAVIERAAQRWLPDYDWLWLKAQCYQESRFDTRAISPAGARGLCQFMPGTWREAQSALGVRDVYSARENSWAAGWHMRRQLNIWSADRSDHQRLELAQASYNAGAGHIIEAQRRCGDPVDWPRISQCLPDVTGHHARETIGYVCSIRGWFRRLQCGPGRP